jgi:hypothetical protein
VIGSVHLKGVGGSSIGLSFPCADLGLVAKWRREVVVVTLIEECEWNVEKWDVAADNNDISSIHCFKEFSRRKCITSTDCEHQYMWLALNWNTYPDIVVFLDGVSVSNVFPV